ncbi:PREDICTED: uncharacterized protein LOC106106111 isoform X3 [Papilio polytes]|uniref:uncharacterized protein LOC106106111 isoform X2 n=1 Tax=Papilio polytes TaxID=76194 RepID=UPI000675BF25|nr:PREDICTED: uncharacterized protein LOC106106111 isoform X2 [Papilio polytes]XP_013142097.1 PREDICTED: uncharacterized protein LOC106106111 isoform X3 [Papilio polytes]
MLSTLSASGVFSSCVDYFCLVCESRLRDEADAAAHVAKPVHTKNFLTTEYFGNEEECVRKIKKWYLCELCNALLATAGGVRLHVAEARHAERRAGRVLRRRAGRVLAFASVQLGDSAWNGIVEDTCAICNTEFDDEHIHRNETTHILKLIQSKLEYDENQNLFRRVDDNIFHCLTCNKLVAFNSIDVHFNDDEHKNLYQRCREQNKLNSDKNKVEIGTETAAPSASIENSENFKVTDNLNITKNTHDNNNEKNNKQPDSVKMTEIEENGIGEELKNIRMQQDEENENKEELTDSQMTRQQDEENENKEDLKDIQMPRQQDEENGNGEEFEQNEVVLKNVKARKIKESSSTLEAKKFANENDMTYLDNDDKVYCNKCKVNIPTSLKCLQEHVSGSAHLKAINKQHLEVALYGNTNESHTGPLKIIVEDFVQSVVFLEGIFKCVVLNDSICVSLLSFSFLVEENNKLKCLICDKKIFTHDLDSHKEQYYHKKISTECFVLRELPSEFIREIKPQHFHCGYCNSLHSPWSAMLTHTKSAEHRESKTAAQIRLQRLMPDIIQHRREQQFNRMMNVFGFMFGANRRRSYYDSDSD